MELTRRGKSGPRYLACSSSRVSVNKVRVVSRVRRMLRGVAGGVVYLLSDYRSTIPEER